MKDIVYQLALNNNPELIIRAAEIEAGLWDGDFKSIKINLYKEKFTSNQRDKLWTDDTRSMVWECEIIAVNPMKASQPFLVQYPNGETGWVNGNRAECAMNESKEL